MNSWYFKRLRTISLWEIPYRIKQYIRKRYEHLLIKINPPVLSEKQVYARKLFDPWISDYDLYKPEIDIFGIKINYGLNEINWHLDIFSGVEFPLKFAKNINIQINPEASAKVVWEINRLQFLPHIALNIKKTGSKHYIDQFIKINNSWIESNPYLIGINWYSNIEVNIRLINWAVCWEILDIDQLRKQDENFRNFIDFRMVPSIYQHCLYSYQNPSKYSSSNNHLIAEYAGLYIASSKWEFHESSKWNEYSRKGLEKEIQRQHSSGINREEAAEYIQFITDFFLMPFVAAENIKNSFSNVYKDTLQKIFHYIYNFLDCKGNYPKYGDEDDGKCINLDYSNGFNNFRSLVTSGSIIFEDPVLKSKSNGYDIKNQFLFGKQGESIYNSIPAKKIIESSKFYSEEGHYIFRKQHSSKEIFMHFDAAPLGFLSIAAHGHADALSFILHIDGDPVFIDPGTYSYHTETKWRKYFIGTLAHNTVRINKKDQALNSGPTMWLKHYKVSVTDFDSGGETERVIAAHYGYKSDNALHMRAIIFNSIKNQFYLLILLTSVMILKQ